MHCLLPTYSNKLEVNNIHLVRGYGEPTDFGRNQNHSCLVISEYRVSQSMLDFFTIQHILNLNIFPLTHTETRAVLGLRGSRRKASATMPPP